MSIGFRTYYALAKQTVPQSSITTLVEYLFSHSKKR